MNELDAEKINPANHVAYQRDCRVIRYKDVLLVQAADDLGGVFSKSLSIRFEMISMNEAGASGLLACD